MTQIHRRAERKIIKWGTETADRFVPAVLRLTDNAETELEELRIETVEGETGITLIRPFCDHYAPEHAAEAIERVFGH